MLEDWTQTKKHVLSSNNCTLVEKNYHPRKIKCQKILSANQNSIFKNVKEISDSFAIEFDWLILARRI